MGIREGVVAHKRLAAARPPGSIAQPQEVVVAGRSNGAGSGATGGTRNGSEAWRALSAADLVGVLDRLTDGILVLDPEWRIRYANEPAGAMSGRRHPDLLGHSIWDEFPEAVDHPFRIACEEALASGTQRRLVERYGPNDRWFESRMLPQEGKLVVLFRDVTEEQLSTAELREYVDRVGEAERIIGFGVWKWELDSGRVSWSDELHHIYGMRPGEFGGTVDAFVERVHPDDREPVWSHISEALETGDPFAFEERITRGDGSERILLSRGRVLVGADGEPQALIGICHDVTARANVEQALGATERRMHAIVDNTPSMITVKDLEGRYLMCNAETQKILGIPSEELVGMRCTDVFPPDVSGPQHLCDQRAAAEGEPVYAEAVLKRGGEERSYVAVTFPLPGEDGLPEETCTIATDVTERKERESERRVRLEWTERIGSALEEGRMLAFAQPIVDVATGEPVSTELLARMRTPGEHPEIVGPGSFLPAAERYELIQRIDVWMVARALELAERGEAQVNVSPLTMGDLGARAEISTLLAAAPQAARRLTFEITETADVARLEAARAFAEEVTGFGSRLALDDFGVGFGSFRYLRALPLSELKIDLSFVRGLTSSEPDRQVVRTIVGIAREFGLKTVAEGVEDAATMELLGELGADLAQGYHLGSPSLIDS
jgi:PAS domain S-box-containing protein